METNFFSQIANLKLNGDLQLIISSNEDNNCVVSVILLNEKIGEKARAMIIPFNLRGSTSLLDSNFFTQITAPMQSVSDFVTNEKNFLEQLEKAKEQSGKQKDKSAKTTISSKQDLNIDKFSTAMKVVADLEAKGKFKEAWMKVPYASEFPEHREEIQKRKSSLSSKFEPDLFNTSPVKSVSADTLQEANPYYPYYADGNIEEIDNVQEYENETEND